MTFGGSSCPTYSAPWYFVGFAAVIPDLLLQCNPITTVNIMWLLPLRIPLFLYLSLAAYFTCACFSQRREVAVRATFLGIFTGLGFQICYSFDSSFRGFGLYIVFLASFHFSEYFITETCNPKKVKLSSFMLNHSPAYNFALACSIFEFIFERHFYPGMKDNIIAIVFGLITCLFGELLRKRAMYIAGSNFDHIVQSDLTVQPHQLVTHDVYKYIQHPSYTGWFIFTIGTQVMLCNPVCLLAFIIVMYNFFEGRVRLEEPALEVKYAGKYVAYKSKTPRFIPYVW